MKKQKQTAEVLLLPFALHRFVPKGQFCPEKTAKALAPILADGRDHAARWWRAHIAKAEASLRRRGAVDAVVRVWVAEYTASVRFHLIAKRRPAPSVDPVDPDVPGVADA